MDTKKKEEYNKFVGQNILKRRKELKMTQEDLAKKLGYKSISAIAKIENGMNGLNQSKLARIAEILETSPSALMGWTRTEAEIDADMELLARIDRDEEFKKIARQYYAMSEKQQEYIRSMVETMPR